MKPKEDLFHLIRSLSKSEKRYFTLDAKKSGAKSSNYLNLFKAINAMKTYDERNLRLKFNNLSVDKAYLYESILKSMRDYRSPKSKGAQLKQKIIDSKFLYERGLYEQCADRLRAAKSLATELSDSLSLLEINKEERRLYKERGISFFRKELERFIGDKEINLEDVLNEFDFLEIYDELILNLKSSFKKFKEKDAQLLIERIDEKMTSEPEGTQSKFRFFQANALYQLLLGNASLASTFFRKSADLWDENPAIKREEFFRYIKDLSNAIAISFSVGEMDTVELLLNKLEKQKPENFNEETIMFHNLITHRINYFAETKQYAKARQIESEIILGFEKFKLPSSKKITITLQLASLLMGNNDLKAGQIWLEKIINFKDPTIRHDIQKASRILHLLLKAETDEYETVELLIRAYHRYFKKLEQNDDVQFELDFLSVMKSLIPFPLEKKERKALLEFFNNPNNPRNMSSLVIRGWMEYKEYSMD